MSNGERKETIRRKLLALRNKLSAGRRAAKSRLIAKKLRQLPSYRAAAVIMFYCTHGSEVGTEQMIQNSIDDGKVVALPISDTKTKGLCAAKICSIEGDCTRGAYGIREPKPASCKPVSPEKIDLVIVPGIAFDARGYRIGYGKGYYDRWLAHFPLRRRAALAYNFQMIDKLPRDKHDARVGTIITENRTIRTTVRRQFGS